MSYEFPLSDVIKTDDPEKWAEHLAYMVECLIGTARIALDNESGGSEIEERRTYMVERTLEVAQAFAHIVGEGCERLQMQNRRLVEGADK